MTRYLAFEGGVMTVPSDTIDITEQQYRNAIDSIVAGKVVSIENGFVAIKDPPQPEAPAPAVEEGE